MKRPVHIIGASAISPQPSFDRDGLEAVAAYTEHPLHVMMPDVAGVLDPVRVRRMTRATRMGLMAALNSLQRAQVTDPGAIIVATGDGCKDSTERFLTGMIEHDETVANPTAFIGSTHNGLAGQIALAVKSRAYNFTYLQRGLSFPSALQDAMLQVGEEGARNVLVGATDVITRDFFITQRRSGLWKQRQVHNLEVLQSTDRGGLAGEGAAFFVLDHTPTERSVEVLGVDAFFAPGPQDMRERVERLNAGGPAIDLVLLGYNGDHVEDRAYDHVKALFPKATVACYKPLIGEYYTANAFGMWLAWSALITGELPAEVVLQGAAQGAFQRALVYDHFQLKDHALMLLAR